MDEDLLRLPILAAYEETCASRCESEVAGVSGVSREVDGIGDAILSEILDGVLGGS